jgi:tetratricopeptide (TPR) repeat protein
VHRARTPASGRGPLLAAVAAALLALPLLASPAHAQSRQRFNRYVTEAREAYERGDADGAIAALERAYQLRSVPLLLFNIARAHELAGRLDRAIEYYDRFLATEPDPEQAQTAREARANAQAQLDARTRQTTAATTTTTPTATTTQTSVVTPHPRPLERPRRFTAVHGALLGGGAALAVAGTVMGVLALGTSREFNNGMPGDANRTALQDRGNALAWGADLGIGLGVVAAAAGLVLYFTQDTQAEAPAAAGGAPP